MDYTLAITSCARFDLLERTLRSFMDRCQHRPSRIVIIEDSDQPQPEFIKQYRHIPTTWINNGQRRGQVFSIERLIQEIKTELVFWTEDDWEFTNSEFLRQSFAVLEKHPEISLVALRDDWGHPLVKDPKYSFPTAEPYWRGSWGGWTWNPGARRLSDMKRFSPVSKYAGYENGYNHEAELSKAYLDAGFRIAVLPGHCRHIGDGRNKTHEKLVIEPTRILIAVKAGHRLNYTKWESLKSPHYNPAIAYNGGPYGVDIHISGPNPRIKAVRETWWKDIQFHKNVTGKFFYGEGADRPPLEDEVFLPVPDDYAHLVDKTQAICNWAMQNNFDYVYLCDDDTYIYVDRLVHEPKIHRFDYAGYLNGEIASGGVGYWLSRKAMSEVVRNMQKMTWAEDVAVGMTMKCAGISPVMIPGHTPGFSAHFVSIDNVPHDAVSLHAVKPEGMYKLHSEDGKFKPRIALILIATGEYFKFVKPLLDSANQFFPAFVPFLWTDSPEEFVENQYRWEAGWPDATLLRYHTILSQRAALSAFDYIFYCDVDMRFVAKIEPGEIVIAGVTATIHPGHLEDSGFPERNPKSTAFIPDGARNSYFAGGFVGGSAQNFLSMAETISKMIDVDRFHGIIAVNNDESYQNRYLWLFPPAKVLSPEYCWPDIPFPSEFSRHWEKVGFKGTPKILALEKPDIQAKKCRQ